MTEIKTIAYDTAKDLLLPRHYSGRTPSISYAYGCFCKPKSCYGDVLVELVNGLGE